VATNHISSGTGLTGKAAAVGRNRSLQRAGYFCIHLVLLVGSLLMILPFFWMISSSLKTVNEMSAFPPVWIPERFVWENYTHMFQSAPWGMFLFNTIKITFFILVGQLITCSMGAYAFARLRFPGRGAMFSMYLATMMIPYQVTMIPAFKIIKTFGWLNTHYALIVPGLFSAFGTFLLRQFFLTIPKELEHSAMIDGCSFPQIYRHIMLPNAKPALTTLAIFTFIWSWNDFLGPLIYLNSQNLKTLTLGLATFQGVYNTQWTYLMAGAVIVTLPVVIVYFLAQRQFVEGLVMSGMKE
jgi:multiple sugar transport system permease protein